MNGNNANDGLSPGAGAFASLQKAVDVAADLDLGIHDVTISLADGSYGAVQLRTLTGAGRVILSGNIATPGAVSVSGAAASAIAAVDISGIYRIEGMTLSSSAEDAITCDGPNVKINIGAGCVLGACSKQHFSARNGATVLIDADYEITGGALRHVLLSLGYFTCKQRQVTLTGTPGFSDCFVLARNVSFAAFAGATFSGAATGSRYLVELNSVISTNSSGPGFLPGDAAGVAAAGGQYD